MFKMSRQPKCRQWKTDQTAILLVFTDDTECMETLLGEWVETCSINGVSKNSPENVLKHNVFQKTNTPQRIRWPPVCNTGDTPLWGVLVKKRAIYILYPQGAISLIAGHTVHKKQPFSHRQKRDSMILYLLHVHIRYLFYTYSFMYVWANLIQTVT